jgi:hypothetical protein
MMVQRHGVWSEVVRLEDLKIEATMLGYPLSCHN